MQRVLTVASVEALGFATAAALCAMLLVMHRRVSTTTARGYTWFWVTGLVYASAAFATACISLAPNHSTAVRAAAESITWSSTCIGPLIFVGFLDAHTRSARLVHAMRIAAGLASAALVVRFSWVAVATRFNVGETSFPTESFYVSLGFALACTAIAISHYRERTAVTARQLRWFAPVASALAALQVIATLASIHHFAQSGTPGAIFGTISTLWVLPWTVVLAFFFAQARFADVALKRTLILLVSVSAAALIVWLTRGAANELSFVVATLAVSAALLLTPAVYRLMNLGVDRYLLRRPNYRALEIAFSESALRIADPTELIASAARLIEDASCLQATVSTTESTQAGGAPIAVFPVGSRFLVIEDRLGARTLMHEEYEFLQTIARDLAQRLESIQFEAERRELQVNEERLQRVLIETELKALRAQVDPHFLFNTLNAIADLISRSPDQAEAMTERLAECFRYALSRQESAMSTLEDELQFIRRYLEIEQVRFGRRLRVEMKSEPTLSHTKVPSLILQPLVENAVRHGLASKLDGGYVRITASQVGDCLRLEVADDGVGFQANEGKSGGVGLRNVRERLQLLYRERAQMTISKGALGGGTSITLLVPSL